MAVNTLRESGGKLAKLSAENLERLRAILPPFWEERAPIDLLRDADVSRYAEALKICLEDQGVDGVLVIFTPQGAARADELAKAIAASCRRCLETDHRHVDGRQGNPRGSGDPLQNNIPTYDTPEEAVRTYLYMYNYERNLEILHETPADVPVDSAPPKTHAQGPGPQGTGRRTDGPHRGRVQEISRKLPYSHHEDLCGRKRRGGRAVIARSEGYPLALKIVSPDVSYKSDAGGVALGIRSEEELRDEYARMMDRVRAFSPECTRSMA